MLCDMYAGACFVAGASVPACASLPPPPTGKSVCQDSRVSQHTLRAGAQHSAQPPHGKEECVKMRAYHNTHYVTVHNIAVDEKPEYGGRTRHR